MTPLAIRRVLTDFGVASAVLTLVLGAAAQQMPQTTTERIEGAKTVTTEQLNGTVAYVDGNDLVVRMSDGKIREFHIPESRRFTIDGNEISVHDLKPGTKLTATVTTTNTAVTERTTTVGTGRVWWVSGNNVILTLPNNENRMYQVEDSYRFTVNGKQATVFDLRKGMVVSAQKIVEAPHTVIASNTVITGHAPPAPKPEVAKVAHPPTPPPAPTQTPAPIAEVAPTPAAPAPTPSPQPEPDVERQLPETASPLPLAGLAGLVLTCLSFALHKLGRR